MKNSNMKILNFIKAFAFLSAAFFSVLLLASARRPTPPADLQLLEQWKAGNVVSAEAVQAYGIDRCFVSVPIPDAVWGRMQGKSFKDNPHIKRDDLLYLKVLHYDYDKCIHVGEMVCNRLIAERLIEIFRLLYDANYPIQRMVLPDNYNADDETQMRANNTSCFCYRAVAGSGSLSRHALGMAVDINPLYNPYYKVRANGKKFVQPSTAGQYCDRNKNFRYKIHRGDLAYKLFTERGFVWGGDWRSCKDFQHFEMRKK